MISAQDFELWYQARSEARTWAVAIVERLYPTPAQPHLADHPNG